MKQKEFQFAKKNNESGNKIIRWIIERKAFSRMLFFSLCSFLFFAVLSNTVYATENTINCNEGSMDITSNVPASNNPASNNPASDDTASNDTTCYDLTSYDTYVTMNQANCARMDSVSLHLNGKIGVNFYIDLPLNAKTVVLTAENGKVQKYNVSDIYRKGSLYCYTYSLAVKELGDEITISIIDKEGNAIDFSNSNNEAGEYCYAANDYLNSILQNESGYADTNPKIYNLCKALNEYSSCLRGYFRYGDATDDMTDSNDESNNTTNLADTSAEGTDATGKTDANVESNVTADSTVTNTERNSTSNADELSAYEPQITWNDEALEYIGTSLILDSNTTIRHYFYLNNDVATSKNENMSERAGDEKESETASDGNVPESAVVISDYSFKVVSDDDEKLIYPTRMGDICYIDITGISAADLDTTFTVKVTNNKLQNTLDVNDNKNAEDALYINDSNAEGFSEEPDGSIDDICINNVVLGESYISYSALGYAYKVLCAKSDSKLQAVCSKMYQYNRCADVYWSEEQSKYVKSVVDIKLRTSNLNLAMGENYKLNATCLPMDSADTKLVWTSSNEAIASVDQNGNVIAVSEGYALIKVRVDSNDKIWAQCLVKVGDTTKQWEIDYDENGEPILGDNVLSLASYLEMDCSTTTAFNMAINDLDNQKNTLYVPAGSYTVHPVDRVRLKSNINIIFDKDAVIYAKAVDADHYDIFRGDCVENVNIYGGNIIGRRYEHKGSYGEWGMGIGLYGCKNIGIYNTKISSCWGDGIYLGGYGESAAGAGLSCENITIVDCSFYNNRRNNLSIVGANKVIVSGCVFDYADGVDPQAGLDIETNFQNAPCKDVAIYNSSFTGNTKWGFLIATSACGVDINGCTFNDGFVNYAGTDSAVTDSRLNSEVDLRYGMTFGENVNINDGSKEEDELVAYYSADWGASYWKSYGAGGSNPMTCSQIIGADDGGRKYIRLQRTSQGSGECGYYIPLKNIAVNGNDSIKSDGALASGDYRFEIVVIGTGRWKTHTSQTSAYECIPMEEKLTTCILTHNVGINVPNDFRVIACDTTNGMYLDVESIKVYRIK